jgi:glycine hydroxymethyltransferase
MVSTATALAEALLATGIPATATRSHQLAVVAERWGDGDAASRRLARANLLTSAIGLPSGPGSAGIRFGTPEIVRRGMTATDMPELAALVDRALTGDPDQVRPDVLAFRRRFGDLHFIRR